MKKKIAGNKNKKIVGNEVPIAGNEIQRHMVHGVK